MKVTAIPSLAGVKVLENRMLGTRSLFLCWDDHLLVHSFNCLLQMTRGVVWHDSKWGCSTWTDAAECRCDVEEA